MAGTITVAPTGNSVIDTLLEGVKWDAPSPSYGFPTAASTWSGYAPGSEPFVGFTALTATQQTAAVAALETWARVANLGFTRVAEPGAVADLRFSGTGSEGTAHTYYPSGSSLGGDAWFGPRLTADQTWMPGDYDFFTAVHEIGHALGLKHPHEAAQFGTNGAAPAELDTIELTALSYRGFPGASLETGVTIQPGSYPQGPMLDDIAAVQHLYGANYATNAGDTVYTFAPTQGVIFQTVWDGGGTDTYDLSGYAADLSVDLGPGGWSTFSAGQLARLDITNPAVLARGNVANAYLPNGDPRGLIENAVGGSGNDALTGNEGANALTGNSGGDTVSGGGGADTVNGNRGDDVLYGNAGNDLLYGGQGADLLFGGAGDDRLFGNLGDDQLAGNLGADTLTGGGGADRFLLSGPDVVTDFNAAEGDRIQIAGTPWTVGGTDGGAVVDLGGGTTVTLLGVAPGAVTAGYFVG